MENNVNNQYNNTGLDNKNMGRKIFKMNNKLLYFVIIILVLVVVGMFYNYSIKPKQEEKVKDKGKMELIDSILQEGIPTGYIFCPDVNWTQIENLNNTEIFNTYKQLCATDEDVFIIRSNLENLCQSEYQRGLGDGQQQGYNVGKSEC